jgi:hypothetical protein
MHDRPRTPIHSKGRRTMNSLSHEVFVNDPPCQDGVLPNGEPKRFSPTASTLIYGRKDAVLTDPGMTVDQARVLGDWVAGHDRNVTDIFITHGHGDAGTEGQHAAKPRILGISSAPERIRTSDLRFRRPCVARRVGLARAHARSSPTRRSSSRSARG